MKSKIFFIISFSILTVVLVFIYINKGDVKLDKNISKIIVETYKREEQFEKVPVDSNEKLCGKIIDNYKKTIEEIDKEKGRVKDETIKETLNNYLSGLELRIKGYESYAKDEIDDFEEFIDKSDKLINPALISFVENYGLDIKNSDYYKFIKNKTA